MKYNKQEFSQNGMKYHGEGIQWKMILFQGVGLMPEIILNLLYTIAYTCTLLAWGYLEYGEAVNKVGLEEKYKNNLN